MRDAPYRNINSSVRTPRYAVFIDKNDKYWKTYVNGIIESFSQTWGGEYFLIVPTDGKTIDDKFWEMLEAYSPDKLGKYISGFQDLQEALPKQYEKVKEQHRQQWKLPDDEFEKFWQSQVKDSHFNGIEISRELSEELKNRLSPFYFQDHIVSENVFRGSTLGFPFTDMIDIVGNAKEPPTKMSVPKKITSPYLKLMALSRTGSSSSEYLAKLEEKGIAVSHVPDNFRNRDYILALEKGQYDFKLQKAISEQIGGAAREYPEEDFYQYLPWRISMLTLGKFYRRDIHREEQENLRVIIGDTISDFCLYYCLSRLHENVFWLPDSFLTKTDAKTTRNKKRKEDEDVEQYSPIEDLTVALVMEYKHKVGYTQKQIGITSASLSVAQLNRRRQMMGNICWINPQEVLGHTVVVPLADISAKCVMRAIEANNYANQQDMIFQDGKSVGRVNTPKPKNFSFIDPANHRWITSLEVSDYCPPVLPFMGGEIMQIHRLGNYEVRVSKDGLDYLSPNIGHFGGDIDVNIVRPELTLVDETNIFKKYFEYSGFSMSLSDKGSYLEDTINRFGSLELTAVFFKDETHRKIFDQFLVKKNNKDDQEIVFLEADRRAYLSFEAIKRNCDSKESPVELIDQLIAKDILRRGLIFQCSRCRRSAWYDLADVSKEFKCKRCDFVQEFYHKNWKNPDEPRWYYHLVETVYLFYDSNSHITALALDKLRQESKVAFHFICESDIINVLDDNKKNELDILAISDGEIIIGECKNTKPVAGDIAKYRTLFNKLVIKPSQFILATTEESVSPEVTNMLSKFKNSRTLTRSDLF